MTRRAEPVLSHPAVAPFTTGSFVDAHQSSGLGISVTLVHEPKAFLPLPDQSPAAAQSLGPVHADLEHHTPQEEVLQRSPQALTPGFWTRRHLDLDGPGERSPCGDEALPR